MTTSANKPKRHFWRWAVVLLLAPIVFWYVATPQVSFHFSDKGQGRLGYILNVQHDISKGEIYPGEATGGAGHIFPNSQFFMEGQMVRSIAAPMESLLKHVGRYQNECSENLALLCDLMAQG